MLRGEIRRATERQSPFCRSGAQHLPTARRDRIMRVTMAAASEHSAPAAAAAVAHELGGSARVVVGSSSKKMRGVWRGRPAKLRERRPLPADRVSNIRVPRNRPRPTADEGVRGDGESWADSIAIGRSRVGLTAEQATFDCDVVSKVILRHLRQRANSRASARRGQSVRCR